MIEQTADPPRDQAPVEEHRPPAGARSALYRVVLGILSALVSINLWTGGPLFALWVGSRVQASIGTLSMTAVGATIGVLIAVTYVLYKMLAWLNVRYYAAIGRPLPRQQAAWLKPMSGERRRGPGPAPALGGRADRDPVRRCRGARARDLVLLLRPLHAGELRATDLRR